MTDFHARSHGESFLEFILENDEKGLYFMDEPEAALSPQRQLTLLLHLVKMAEKGSQFIIVTHSPILLGTPDADIVSFDEGELHRISYEETESYQVTKLFLENRLTLAADFLYEDWANAYFDNEKGQFKNRTRVAAGAEFIPRYDNRNYLGRIRYRAGFHYLRVSRSEENGYKGHGYNEYGASIGFGLPLIDNRSLVNLSFEYVKIRPELRTMIDEQYFRFTVNYTFNELWFFKRKVD